MRLVWRSSRPWRLLVERSRLSPLFAFKSVSRETLNASSLASCNSCRLHYFFLFSTSKIACNFGNSARVTDVTFRFRIFMVMIRLTLITEPGAKMDRRKERRLDLELPVRIWGIDRMGRPFAELVRVRNVSNRGAVLIGMRAKVQEGDVLDVQNGASRTQFRIVWMTSAGEAGIEAFLFEPPILGVGLPHNFEMVGSG